MNIGEFTFGIAMKLDNPIGFVFCTVGNEMIWHSEYQDLRHAFYSFAGELIREFPDCFPTIEHAQDSLCEMMEETSREVQRYTEQRRQQQDLLYFNLN